MGSHKFSLFYSQRLAYIRNKRDKKKQKGETRGGRNNKRRKSKEPKEGKTKELTKFAITEAAKLFEKYFIREISRERREDTNRSVLSV